MTLEEAAKLVYSGMVTAAACAPQLPGNKAPEWVENGNSDMQVEARRIAFAIRNAPSTLDGLQNRTDTAIEPK